MEIITATTEHLSIIHDIATAVICDIYPRYYPKGAVDIFLGYQTYECIQKDIERGSIYLLKTQNGFVGTVTVVSNHVSRLFVLKEHQRKGYGTVLLRFAEQKIFEQSNTVLLCSSLPSVTLYQKHSYQCISFHTEQAKNGDVLWYPLMEKKKQSSIIRHTAVYVRDLEGAKAFYTKYFSCSANDKYHNPKTGLQTYFLTFDNHTKLELMYHPKATEKITDETLTGYCHLAIGVGSKEAVDSLTERLRNDGYVVVREPRTTGDGYYESVVLDPESNSLEITI
jgi:lactoylglutathione lyase